MKTVEKASWIYYAVRVVGWVYFKLFHRLVIRGAENVPLQGPCILASNHASYFDPPVIACWANRRIVRFLARDTLLRGPISRWFLPRLEIVPIDRTRGDIAALRKGVRVLGKGGVLGLFPEGTRSPDGALHPAKGGIGFLIVKGKAPVVPVYVEGSFRALRKGAWFPRFTKMSVTYGTPIDPAVFEGMGNGRALYEKAGDLVMSRIAELRPK